MDRLVAERDALRDFHRLTNEAMKIHDRDPLRAGRIQDRADARLDDADAAAHAVAGLLLALPREDVIQA